MPHRIQKKVGLAVAIAAFLLAIVAFLSLVFITKYTIISALAHQAVYGVFLIGVGVLLTGLILHKVTRLIQASLFVLTGCIAALDARWGNLTSEIFLGIGYILLAEYGFLENSRTIKTVIIGIAYFIAFFIGFTLRKETVDLGFLHTVIGLVLIAYLVWLMVSERIKQHEEREIVLEQIVQSRTRELEESLEKSSQLVEEKNELLNEKDLLLKEVHHRTKNNMQLISSLLSLENDRISDNSALEAIGKCQNRIQALSVAHEYLHQSENLINIDLGEYIQDFVSTLWQDLYIPDHRLNFNIQKEINTDIDFAIHLGIILNELIANIAKYAFPEKKGGNVTITLNTNKTGIKLDVQDDGIGLPESIDIRQPSSLGIKIVISLVRQLHGEVHVLPREGTCWEFQFPVKDRKSD